MGSYPARVRIHAISSVWIINLRISHPLTGKPNDNPIFKTIFVAERRGSVFHLDPWSYQRYLLVQHRKPEDWGIRRKGKAATRAE